MEEQILKASRLTWRKISDFEKCGEAHLSFEEVIGVRFGDVANQPLIPADPRYYITTKVL